MKKIEEVQDKDIFIKTNSLTNAIRGKRLRKRLLDHGIKVEIRKEKVPVSFLPGMVFHKEIIRMVFHRPKSLDKEVMNDIVHYVSEAIWRRYDIGHTFDYVDTEG